MAGSAVSAEMRAGTVCRGLERVLVVVGVTFEQRGLARRLGIPCRASLPDCGGPRLMLRTVGLRAVALHRLEPSATVWHPSVVVVTGLSGGCAPDLTAGEIVVGSPVGSASSGEWLVPAPTLVARAMGALQLARVPHRAGPLLTVPDLMAAPAAKADCWREHGAVAVDMESATVLAWAARLGVPAVAVRAVADGPTDTLPVSLARAVGPGGNIRLAGVLGLATEPAKIRLAWRLWRSSRIGLDRLALFLAAFAAADTGGP